MSGEGRRPLEALTDLRMLHEIVMRHRSPHFGHIFSSAEYAAGNCGYMWADALMRDRGFPVAR